MKAKKTKHREFNRSRRTFLNVVVASLLVTVCGLALFATCRQRVFTPVRTEYDGVIVDKWMGFTQSEEGSFPYYRLLVEEDSKARITVRIDYDIYQRAKVGMSIRNNQGSIELGAQSDRTNAPGR